MSTPTDERGDLLIGYIYVKHPTDCILWICVPRILMHHPTVLLSHEREKNKKYLQACLDQRRHFSPFVLSCDGSECLDAKPRHCSTTYCAKPCRKARREIRKVLRIPKLHEVKDENCNCFSSHTSMHASDEHSSPLLVCRRMSPNPEQQTFSKLNKRVHDKKIDN